MKTNQQMTVQLHGAADATVDAFPDSKAGSFITVNLGGVMDPCRVSLFFESTDEARAWANRILATLARTIDPAVPVSEFDEPHRFYGGAA